MKGMCINGSARLNKWSVCINFGGSSHRWPWHGLVSGLEEMVTWCGDGEGGYGGGGARPNLWWRRTSAKTMNSSINKWKKEIKFTKLSSEAMAEIFWGNERKNEVREWEMRVAAERMKRYGHLSEKKR